MKRGEAVELVKEYAYDMSPSRFFFSPDDPHVADFLNKGYQQVGA